MSTEDPFKKRKIISQKPHPMVIRKSELETITNHAHPNRNYSKLDPIRRPIYADDEIEKQKHDAKELREEMLKTEVVNVKQNELEKDLQIMEEEALKEKKRTERKEQLLSRAYKAIFEQTDRVRTFNIAKHLAETIKERDAQVAQQKSQGDVDAKLDAEYNMRMLRDMEKYNDEEESKKAEKKEKKKINFENWSKQCEDKLRRIDELNKKNKQDGFYIKDDTKQYRLKEQEKIKQNILKMHDYKKNLDEQIKEKILLLDKHQELDESAEANAKQFNETKKAMVLEHRNVKKDLDEKKQLLRNQVAKTLASDATSAEAKEEEIYQKALREVEVKASLENARKEQEKENAIKSFKEFYAKEMAAKSRKEYDDRLRSFRDRRDILNSVEKKELVDRDKDMKRHNLEKEVQHTQLHQIAQRNEKKMDDKIEKLKDYLAHMNSLDEEEAIFQKYAQMQIDKCEAAGINTQSLVIAARPGIECGNGPLFENRGQIRPKYYASVWNPDDLGHIERKTPPDTKSRLGFTS